MAINILLEASPLDNGIPTTIRMSSAAVRSDGVQLDNAEWLPVIIGAPNPSFSISDGGNAVAPMTVSMGSVNFRIGKRYANQHWNKLSWVGAPVTMWIGETHKPFSSYRQFFTGTLSGLARTGSVAELALRTVEGQLDVPLLSARYAGTGAQEGPQGKKGTLKPYCAGHARFVSPVEVDPALLVYQVHGYGPVADIPTVYEFAQALAPSKGDAATWQALASATLKPGEWMTCKALGMFRLGGRPDKKLTADVIGAQLNGSAPQTVAQIVPLFLQEAGVSPQRIGDMSALDFGWSFYSTEEITVAEAVKQAALDAGGYVLADRYGVWRCGRHRASKPAVAIRSDRTSEPLLQTINELNVTDPTWKVEVGHSRCWSVHSESDISPALIELEGKIVAADEVLEGLKEQAEQIAADAAFARVEIEAMIADGVLDRADKRRAIDRLEAERVRHDQLEGVYAAYNVPAEWAAYDVAWKAVEAYMLALTPSIYDNSAVTPVNRTTYLQVWIDYEVTLQKLLSTITKRTVGAPGNAPIGGVVLPDGTIVGSRPADEVIADVDKANENADAIRTQLPDLVLPILKQPIEELSALHLTGSAANLKASHALHRKNLVAIQDLRVYVDENGALVAEELTQLTSRVGEAEETMEAGFLEINRTIADKEQALSESITDQIANYGETVTAQFIEERRVRSTKDEALAESVEQLAGRVEEDGEALTGQIDDVRQLVIDKETALGTRIEAINLKVETAEETLSGQIDEVSKLVIDKDSAMGTRVDQLGVKIEPRRVCRRPLDVSHAAISMMSAAA